MYCEGFPFAWSCDSRQVSLLAGTLEQASEEGREVRRAKRWGVGVAKPLQGAPSPNSQLVGGFYPLLKPCNFQPFAVGRKECRVEELPNATISIGTNSLPGH